MKTKITKSKLIRRELEKNLETFNFSKCEKLNPIIYKTKNDTFGIYLFEGKQLIGGAYVVINYYNWAWLDLLWINETFRNQKLGTKLIAQVIEICKQKNCVGIRTETWEFQAKDFYLKQGFKLFGELEDSPVKEYFLALKF